MSLAIAYQMKKRGQKMAHGGMEGPCEEHGSRDCEMCHGGEMAKGGDVDEAGMRYKEVEGVNKEYGAGSSGTGISEAGNSVRAARDNMIYGRGRDNHKAAKRMMESAKDKHRETLEEMRSMKKPNLYAEGGDVDEEHDEHDMVSRIMKQRSNHYSEGGRVANEDHIEADFEPNEFDDLAKDDHLEFHDTGANSGDELGDEQEDEDRHDIVSRIMKSRRKMDRLPHPM